MTIAWSRPDEVDLEAVAPPLVVALEDGIVVAAIRMNEDGSTSITWTAQVTQHTLPEIEAFILAVARFIAVSPIDEGS